MTGNAETNGRLARVDASIATQLQQLNTRMKERLRRLQDHPSCPIDVYRAIADILVDQEPAWHRG